MRILAIDPGREKCGLAVGDGRAILARAIVPAARLGETVRDWAHSYGVDQIILGDRTAAEAVLRELMATVASIPVILVSEEDTTLRARRRYFADHPPQGWRRLLPLSMQLPPEPYDDYAAVVILERQLAGWSQQAPDLRKNL